MIVRDFIWRWFTTSIVVFFIMVITLWAVRFIYHMTITSIVIYGWPITIAFYLGVFAFVIGLLSAIGREIRHNQIMEYKQGRVNKMLKDLEDSDE